MLGDFFNHTLDDPFGAQCEAVRRWRYGVIETLCGSLVAIHLRPWPCVVSALEADWLGQRHKRRPGDRCLIYYNQPRRHANFLALKYMVSNRDCTLATCFAALAILDEVARIKRSDAILCDAWNERISARLLAREGWEPHKPDRWHRNYIKRFYGVYPQPALNSAGKLASSRPAAAEC